MKYLLKATNHALAFLILLPNLLCFVPRPLNRRTTATIHFLSANDNMELGRVESSGRRKMIESSLLFGVSALMPLNAVAEDAVSPDVVAKAFSQVRFELEDPNGGVSIMQKLIDEQNWSSLLDFTKTYDQVLRKAKMGSARKLLPKESQDAATLASNAVTFDLIGINRASRKGQESAELANKYLNELRNDVNLLLKLQETIQ